MPCATICVLAITPQWTGDFCDRTRRSISIASIRLVLTCTPTHVEIRLHSPILPALRLGIPYRSADTERHGLISMLPRVGLVLLRRRLSDLARSDLGRR